MELGKPYDMVILDLTIPGAMGGNEALAELIKIDPKTKAVVSSGYVNNDSFGGLGQVKINALKEAIREIERMMPKTAVLPTYSVRVVLNEVTPDALTCRD